MKKVTQISINGLPCTEIELVYGDISAIMHKYSQNKALEMDELTKQKVILVDYQTRDSKMLEIDVLGRHEIAYYEKCIELYEKSDV